MNSDDPPQWRPGFRRDAVRDWKTHARRLGILAAEQEIMARAFQF